MHWYFYIHCITLYDSITLTYIWAEACSQISTWHYWVWVIGVATGNVCFVVLIAHIKHIEAERRQFFSFRYHLPMTDAWSHSRSGIFMIDKSDRIDHFILVHVHGVQKKKKKKKPYRFDSHSYFWLSSTSGKFQSFGGIGIIKHDVIMTCSFSRL